MLAQTATRRAVSAVSRWRAFSISECCLRPTPRNQTFGFAGTFRARSAVRFHRWKRLFCWKEPQSHQGRDCEISTRPFGRSLRGPFEEGGGKAAAAKSVPSNPCQRLTRSCNLLPRQPELVAVQSRKLGEHASSHRGWRHGGVH